MTAGISSGLVAAPSDRAPRLARQQQPSASTGPWLPDAYCGSGPGVISHCCTIGSQMCHCASTSSLRVKSVASPRIASMISRSYASGDWEMKAVP